MGELGEGSWGRRGEDGGGGDEELRRDGEGSGDQGQQGPWARGERR